LTVVFTGLLDGQALLGLALLVGLGLRENELPPTNRILHALTMFFAVAAAHQTARWRQADPPRRFRNGLIAFGLALALIGLGLAVVVQTS